MERISDAGYSLGSGEIPLVFCMFGMIISSMATKLKPCSQALNKAFLCSIELFVKCFYLRMQNNPQSYFFVSRCVLYKSKKRTKNFLTNSLLFIIILSRFLRKILPIHHARHHLRSCRIHELFQP